MPDEPLVVSPYEDWISYVFDHPVTNPEWHWDLDAEWWDEEKHPAEVVAYMTALFENSGAVLARFTNGQLNQGFHFLASASCSSHLFALLDMSVPWGDRRRCIQSMKRLYGRCFRSRCSAHLSHLDEPGSDTLNSACYMWFDMIPIHGRPEDPTRRELDAQFLDVLRGILWIPHDACREAAIHGLGEWHLYDKPQTQAIIDQFLARTPDIRPELAAYAARARIGYIP